MFDGFSFRKGLTCVSSNIFILTENLFEKSSGLGYIDKKVSLSLSKSPCVRIINSNNMYYNTQLQFDSVETIPCS